MSRGIYLFALPIIYAGLLPDNWFKHFKVQGEDKEDVISAFCNFSYAFIYLSSKREYEVYFANNNTIEDNNITIYHDLDEIKEAVFNALLEYS